MIQHIILWLAITVISIFLTPAMVDKNTYIDHIRQEQQNVIDSFGQESGMIVINRADAIYKALFEKTGLQKLILGQSNEGQNKSDNDLAQQSSVDKALGKSKLYLVKLLMNLNEGIFRIIQLSYWLSYASPFLVAAIVDGIMQRKVKIATFHYSSPGVYNAMCHVLIIMFFGTLVYCDSPMPMAPLVFPGLLLVTSLMIRAMLSNLQRSA